MREFSRLQGTPRGLEMMLKRPKIAARLPAATMPLPKVSEKYAAMTLSTVSSTPKQYPYVSIITHVR